MSDLRQFLDQVKKARPADVVEVDREVDPKYETAAIVTKLEERGRSPIIRFNRVRGSKIPLVTNVCGSMGRLALAMQCPLKEVSAQYAQRAAKPKPPVLVDGADAPCQQVIKRGEDVDLGILPALVYHADDATEPYITAGIVVAKDPDTHKTNLSYHRLMIAGPNRTGILIERGKHLDGILTKHTQRGTDMPIAVFVGAHPLWSLGALYSGSPDDEEYAVIGGLLGHPLELVSCVSNPGLAVPAGTELVLEGKVSHTARIREGPFGEFTGYGTGVGETPVFEVSALTHREDFWFQDIVSGRMEHLVLSLPALEERTLKVARGVAAGVTRVALPAALTAVVAVKKQNDHEPRRIIEALLRSDIYAKHVFVVDDDVDPNDLRAVLGAMALQTQADTKVHVLPREQGTPLDPSCPSADGVSAKMGIDATRALQSARPVTKNRLPEDVLARIDVGEFLRRRK